jgi:hypothetical protein
MNAFGRLLHDQGKLAEAEPLLRESMDKLRRVSGDDNPNTINAIINYGAELRSAGKLDEAEPLCREAVERTQRVFGKDHVRTGSARLALGRVLTTQQRFGDAETELFEAHRIFVTAKVVPPSYRTDSTNGLAKLYDAWNAAEPNKGYDSKAAEWRARLEPPSTRAAPGS